MKNLILVVFILISFLGFSQEKTYKVFYNEAPKSNKPLKQPVADSAEIANFVGIEIFPIIENDFNPKSKKDEILPPEIKLDEAIIILDGQTRIVIELLKFNARMDSSTNGKYHIIFSEKHKRLVAEANSLMDKMESLIKKRPK